MARRGRPISPRAASARVVHIKLRLYPGEDDDLITFFDAIIPRLRAAMVKKALRSGGSMALRDAAEDGGSPLESLEALVF